MCLGHFTSGVRACTNVPMLKHCNIGYVTLGRKQDFNSLVILSPHYANALLLHLHFVQFGSSDVRVGLQLVTEK